MIQFVCLLPVLCLIGFQLGYYVVLPQIYNEWNVWYGICGLELFGSILFVVWLKRKNHKGWLGLFQTIVSHIEKLSRFIVSQNYYVSVKKENRQRITYFPKVYYRYSDRELFVRFPLDLGKFQERFLKLTEILETGLSADVVDIEYEKDYIVYRLLYLPFGNRLTITEMEVTDKTIQLMKGVVWEFAKMPHALISGGTGSGKTYTMQTILYAFLKIGADIVIADPKMSDLSFLEDVEVFNGKVFYSKNTIAGAIRKFKEEMEERQQEYRERSNRQVGLNYFDLGYKPKVLVLDEFNAYMSSFSRMDKVQEEVSEHLKQVLMLGRQLGFFVVIGMQRADAQYLPDGMRDQFGLRIALGKMSEQGLNMMFGDERKQWKSKEIRGFGYCFIGYGRVKEFYSPYIPKDFEFINEFNILISDDS